MRCILFGSLSVIVLCCVPIYASAQADGPAPAINLAAFNKTLRAKLTAGMPDEATAHFKKTLTQAKTAQEKKNVRDDYLREMARAGKPLEAYRAFPGGKESFAILAEQLVASGRSASLTDLIKEHETFFDDDPFLSVFRGQLAYEKKEYARADEAWTTAFKSVSDEYVRSQFHRRWVRARAGAGKTIEVLDIPPARQSFRIAAELFLENRENDRLEKLIDEHTAREPATTSTSVTYRLRMNEKADAATLLKIGQARPYSNSAIHFLVSEQRTMEAYHAGTDRIDTFKALASSLIYQGDIGTLRSLIELHREKHADDPEIVLIEGKMFRKTAEFDKSLAAFQKAYANKPRFGIAFEYHDVLYRSGNAIKAYEESGFASDMFSSLARNAVLHRDAKTLEALLKARPVAAKGTADRRLWEYQADLKILTGKPDEALALFLEARKELAQKNKKGPDFFGKPKGLGSTFETSQAKSDEREFAQRMATIGKGLEVYRVAAFPDEVFSTLALHYRRESDADGLDSLIKAHSVKRAKDPELDRFRGMLDLIQGNTRSAEASFRAELAKPAPTDSARLDTAKRSNARLGLLHTFVRQGRTVEQYRAAGSDAETFLSIARICVAEKALTELVALLEEHRTGHPKDRQLKLYEGEAAFLKGDYERAWESFKDAKRVEDESKAHLFKKSDDAFTPRDKALVSLVRMKRFKEAVLLAKDWEINSPSENPIPMILAHAAAGDVKQTMRLIGMHANGYVGIADFYRNEDLGPLLRGETLRSVRERFPDPAKVRK